MPTYSSISYHDLDILPHVLEHQATQSWTRDVERMKFKLIGQLSFEIQECKLPTGMYVNRVVTSGEYEREG